MNKIFSTILMLLLLTSPAWGFELERCCTYSPVFTGIITLPAGSVTAPSVVSDDANSGFYFGSKGFNWSVDGVSKFYLNNVGTGYFSGNLNVGLILVTPKVQSQDNDTTLILQDRNYTAADNMVEIAKGTTTFTGFDGEIIGTNIMPTVGVLDDGDTMTLLKLSPTGTPASTLGILNGLAFGNWGGTGTDKAYQINLNATGYDADIVRSNTTETCGSGEGADLCTDVLGAYVVYVTTTAATTDVMAIADGIAGQEKLIVLKTDGGADLDVTPTNFANGTKITFDTAGESVLLHFDGTKWFIIASYGGVIS